MNSIISIDTDGKETEINSQFDIENISHRVFQSSKQLSWEYGGKIYRISNQGQFAFYPAFVLAKLGLVWQSNDIYKHPQNFVIYNADATVHKVITVPPFISSELLNDGYVDNSKPGMFENFSRLQNIEGSVHFIVNISAESVHVHYGRCLHVEKRALQIESGEFHPTWCKGGIYW